MLQPYLWGSQMCRLSMRLTLRSTPTIFAGISLHDSLYSVYQGFKTTNELCESLDCKYKSDDAGAKKFLVGRFLDFKMVDSRTVMSQVHEFQVLLHEIQTDGIALSESFQVVVAIEKLPPGWKDFKNYLQHKRKEMAMEDLVVKLQIE
ncbi:hypothetical protein CRG98_033235 [Punica granatum]|uniref:Uncharacterized protein n=1 Tax=Punica granatum TaxID=22663 RepID=A0A2I0IRN3_PUNGR|nr:hypothetical protein CRG98_033235 [Punica granatum]